MGRVDTRAENVQGTTNSFGYTYDTSGRLSTVTKNSAAYSSYTYDSNSNRTSGNTGGTAFTASYDAQDRMSSFNVNNYTYTNAGELSTKVNSVTSATTTYVYHVLGNLKSVTLPSGSVITYLADGYNRRAVRKLNGTITSRYFFVGTQLMAELTSAKAFKSVFVYGTKAHVPDYMIVGADKYRIVTDHLGSVRMVVKVSDGSIAQKMDYDELGRVLSDTNPGFQPFGFAGGLYDSATGLVRFGARDYDPEVGRWTGKDPIIFGGSDPNLYGYTYNDPLNGIDPLGLWTIQLGYAFNGTFFGGNAMGGFGFTFDGHGNFGGYQYSGGGGGLGASGGHGGSLQVSNADSICDLGGKFANSSAYAGGGVGASVDVFSGHDPRGTEINGAGLTLGSVGGASISSGVTNTHVFPWNGR